MQAPPGGMDRVPDVHIDTACPDSCRSLVGRRRRSKIHNGGQFDPGVQQIERYAIGLVVGRQDHCAAARAHAVQLDQPLCRGTQQNAGQVVIAKQRGLFECSRTEDDAFRTQLDQPVAEDDRKPVVCVPAVHHRAGHQFDVW